MKLFVDVILPLPLPRLFTYHVPEELEGSVHPFIRVTLPFGKKKLYTAIVVSVHANKPADYQTKGILEVLDETPIIRETQYKLWEWMADYYLASVGEVMKAALPSGLKPESETKIFFNPQFTSEETLAPQEGLILEVLADREMLTVGDIEKLVDVKSVYGLLKKLQTRKAIVLEESIKETYRPKSESFVVLEDAYRNEAKLNDVMVELGRAPKQLAVLVAYFSISKYFDKWEPYVNKQELLKKADAGAQALQALVKRGVVKVEELEASRLLLHGNEKGVIKHLSDVQQKAMDEIETSFTNLDVTLLHGVTSSGKTEIYIHLIQKQLEKGKQVLYLLPEIALTTQIINRLRLVFGDKVGIYHSKFSDAERVEVYQELLKSGDGTGRFSIILGVRSSVFLPFNNLGLIIVDEEHENTYKQYDPAPRYHARDVAVMMGGIHSAKVLLGTATPSIESYYNAKQGKYGYVELLSRHKNIQLPEIRLVNIREARRRRTMKSMFSPLLIDSMEQALRSGEQIILFQNRRGFSPYLECETCGWIPHCIHCDVSLTYHKAGNSLVCHYCSYTLKNVKTCKQCGSVDVQTRGFGTEKIEDEVAVFFPEAKIARMDLDSTRKKKAYEQLIESFENHRIDILIGTQMLSKGLDFNNVSLVGILNADNMLNFPDFRAYERSFQLLLQVSGRAGRDKKQGKVVVQTGDPTNHILQCVLENDYTKMVYSQLHERKTFKYPPFYRLIRISVRHKRTDMVSKASTALANSLRSAFGNRVVGPEFPVIARVQQYYIKTILLKMERDRSNKKGKVILLEKINDILADPLFRTVKITLDVDPQ